MPRRLRRRSVSYGSRPYKTVKYSNETVNFTSQISLDSGSNLSASLISSTNVQGMRKAKNFTLKMIYNGPYPLLWVLVYVPEGTSVSALSIGQPGQVASTYEPSQNVIMSGYLTPNGAQSQVFRTRLARNLNSGDSIQIVFCNPYEEIANAPIGISLNYAITY